MLERVSKRTGFHELELSIVVVTHGCGNAAEACLDSLRACGIPRAGQSEVIVVDSASPDDTPARLARRPDIDLICLRENVGFARAANVGAKHRRGRDVLFLNPDTVAPPNSVDDLHRYLRRHPTVAAVAPKLYDLEGNAQIVAQSFPSLRHEVARQWMPLAPWLGLTDRGDRQPDCAGPVDWVSGACFLVRGEALAEVGGFDERFFLYFEETDWCRRATRLGWEIHVAPHIEVAHAGGASARTVGAPIEHGRLQEHFARSRRWYFRKNHGRLIGLAARGVHAVRRIAQVRKRAFRPLVGTAP